MSRRLMLWIRGLWTNDQCPYSETRPSGPGYVTWYCQKRLGHLFWHATPEASDR